MILRMRAPLLLLSLLAAGLALGQFQASAGVPAPATPDFVVDTIDDDPDDDPGDGDCETAGGDCTLRAAMEEANAGDDPVVIGFDIDGALVNGFHTIEPADALPVLVNPTFIDGSTDPDFAAVKSDRGIFYGTPVIEISGASLDGADEGTSALVFEGGASGAPDDEGAHFTNGFRSLLIRDFPGDGAIFRDADGGGALDSILGVYEPADSDGNSDSGLRLLRASFVLVENNYVAGNFGDGITIEGGEEGDEAANNVVRNNWIGLRADNTTPGGNSFNGVYIEDASDNLIGGPDEGDGNVIVDNGQDGVHIVGDVSSGNVVSGNAIGMPALADTAAVRGDEVTELPNGGDGVHIVDGYQNVVGGEDEEAGNLISGNLGAGVYVEGTNAAQNTIQYNLIGTDGGGTLAYPNLHGVVIDAAPGTAVYNNLISGNKETGVSILDEASTADLLDNIIGLNRGGDAELPNGTHGVFVDAAGQGNKIGSAGVGGNVISGNAQDGVRVVDTEGAEIFNNYIGTDLTGELALGNGGAGVSLESSGGSTIGEVDSGNLIAGNGGAGVALTDGSTANVVQANIIGLAVDSVTVLEQQRGILVEASASNLIGGTGEGEGNVVSGHQTAGIQIAELGSAGNSVYGNLIGTDVTGTLDRGNTIGILIVDAPSNNIGQASGAGRRNVISGNTNFGVQIAGEGATSNVLRANYIGTTVTGSSSLPNGLHGVYILDADGNDIGDPSAGAGNLISGNSGDGILVETSSETTITNNLIGLVADGTAGLGNGGSGVRLLGSTGTVIGGVTGNVISGNGEWGVVVGEASVSTELTRNFIGTDAAGAADLGNLDGGVHVFEAAATELGETDTGNVISGNGGPGVYLEGATGSVVWDNLIGVAGDGETELGNDGPGVQIDNSAEMIASDNSIGDGNAGRGNVIRHNGEEGIIALAGSDNSFLSNSIDENDLLGIDLVTVGVTPNDNEDPDAGPNGLQNFPDLASAEIDDGTITITGTINSTPGTQLTLQFFASPACDASGYGEGRTLLGTAQGTTDLDGNAAIAVPFASTAVSAGDVVTATATNPFGSTSEFSECVTATAAEPEADLTIDKEGSPDAVTAGATLTYVITVTNDGPDGATGVEVTDDLPDGLTFVSATPTVGNCEGTDVVTCDIGSLANGESATITIVVTTTVAGQVQNTATVTAVETDPDPSNNSDTETNEVTAVQADLGISKQLGIPGDYEIGDELTYLITVGNDGPSGATNVEVTDDLADGVVLVSATASQGACGNGDPVVCSLGNLVSGQVETVTIVVRLLNAGTLTNTATIEGAEADPELADNTSSVTLEVAPFTDTLFEGWNLIEDWPAPDVNGVPAIIAFLDTALDPPAWQAVAYYTGLTWQQTFQQAPLPSFNTLTFIESGDDIWVFVTAETTLTFTEFAP